MFANSKVVAQVTAKIVRRFKHDSSSILDKTDSCKAAKPQMDENGSSGDGFTEPLPDNKPV